MYAICEDGSRQYRVEEGSLITVDYRDVKPGDSIEFGRVLMTHDGSVANIGAPHVAGAKVVGQVVGMPRVKTVIQKFRRRKNSKRLKGHTQPFVQVKITSITI